MKKNQRVFPTMPLLEQCNYCGGFCTYTYEKDNELITKPCKHCNGKGLLVLGEEAIKYYLEEGETSRKELIKIYKKELPIPHKYKTNEKCYSCSGSGKIYKKISEEKEKIISCKKCKGIGYFYKTEKEMYKEISSEISSSKNGRNILLKYLKEKTYEKPEYKEYNTYRISKHYWVCIRCEHYRKEEYECYGCGNENHGLSKKSYFLPINNKVKNWYNKTGHKYNLGYDPIYDYTIK